MNAKLALLLSVLLALGLFLAGCDCGGDDDDDHGPGIDDDTSDDDTGDDDDDDSADDDSADDDSDDDDSVDDDSIDDDSVDDDTVVVCDWDTYDPLIVAGREALADYDPDTGYDRFTEALAVCPDWPDAKMGLLLADTQWYTKMIYGWIKKLSNFNPAPHEDGKSIGTVIQRLIKMLMLPVNAEMFALVEDLETNHPDVRFYFPELPMVMEGDHVVLDFAGEWDIADMRNVRSAAGLLEAFERFLLAFNFDFNYNTFAFWPPPAPGATIEEIIHSYSELILTLLADPEYPDFLNFLDEGKPELVTSGINLGHGCLDFDSAFKLMLEETDPQTDDVAGYVDRNGNGVWDEGEPYFTPYFGPFADELNLAFLDILKMMSDLGSAALDGGPADPNPLVPNWFPLSDLNVLLQFFGDLIGIDELPPIPVPIGTWFYNPLDDGLRSTVGAIAQLLYDLTAPEGGAL